MNPKPESTKALKPHMMAAYNRGHTDNVVTWDFTPGELLTAAFDGPLTFVTGLCPFGPARGLVLSIRVHVLMIDNSTIYVLASVYSLLRQFRLSLYAIRTRHGPLGFGGFGRVRRPGLRGGVCSSSSCGYGFRVPAIWDVGFCGFAAQILCKVAHPEMGSKSSSTASDLPEPRCVLFPLKDS